MTQSSGETQEKRAGFWQAVREALIGTGRDFTEGKVGKAILILAAPMVLEMCMESLFGVVDVFWVARLGADAMATVGLTESMLTILFAVALGLSMAATATVARRVGEKNPLAAGRVAVQAIAVGIAVSAAIGITGYFTATRLLRAMGASDALIQTGSGYTRMILGGSVTIFLLFVINAVFRGSGDATTAMRALWLANIVNILLNPCLIFGWGPFPRMGVTGSAVGTTIGRGIGVLFQLWVLTTGRSRVRIGVDQLRLDFAVMTRLVRLSLGGMFQYFVQVASWIGLVRIVSTFGSPAIAGYTLALRIVIFAILPSWGLSNAAATLVGQNLGAGKPDRAEHSVWLAGFYNLVFLGSVGLMFILFAERLVAIFTLDPFVTPVAVTCLRYLSYGYFSYAYGMVIAQAFNGAGDTVTPTILNFFCYWLCQIPLAFWLAYYTGLGASGVFVAVVVSDTLLAVGGIVMFRRGTWKTRTV